MAEPVMGLVPRVRPDAVLTGSAPNAETERLRLEEYDGVEPAVPATATPPGAVETLG